MRLLSLSLIAAMAGMAGTATAQLAHPYFERTYCGSSRGTYFQVPAAVPLMVVTHIQVPDETNMGTSAFAIYKFAAKVPAYPATVPGNPLVYKTGSSSGRHMLVPPLTFKGGEWFGVIGVSGSATSACTSYAPVGGFPTTVLGHKTTMLRFLMQANLFTNKGVFGMSSEDAYNVGRVRIWVAGCGSAIAYGKSMRGNVMPLDQFPPNIGMNGKFLVNAAGTNQGAVLFLGLGRQTPAIPTPFGDLNVKLPFVATLVLGPVPATGTVVSLPIPPLPGLVLAWQPGIIELLKTPEVQLANGLEWIIGK